MPGPHGVAVDPSDLQILGAMSRQRISMWGGVDPRVSSADIADRVGLHPSTVRARIRDWQDCGFLRGYDVLVHPALFGAEWFVASVRLDDPAKRSAFFDELGLVEGVCGALDHVGGWVGVGLALDHPGAAGRRGELLAKLPGVGEVEVLFPARLPPPTVDPTRLDWRIVRELRRGPDDTLAATADRVGVTAKTLRRRYRALLEGHAIWTVARLDFRRYTGGSVCRVNLFLDDVDDREAVRSAFSDRYAAALEMNPLPPEVPGTGEEGAGEPGEPGLHERVVEYLLHLPSAAQAEDVLRDAASLPGVAEAEVLFPRRYHAYPDYLDERVEKACTGER